MKILWKKLDVDTWYMSTPAGTVLHMVDGDGDGHTAVIVPGCWIQENGPDDDDTWIAAPPASED